MTIARIVRAFVRTEDARKVMVIVGRSTALSGERRAAPEATRKTADELRAQVFWLDLDSRGCNSSNAGDAVVLAQPGACGVLTDPSSVERTMALARAALEP